ncbi:MAG: hypothetical protein WC683_02225 [bacterium]
MAKYIDVLITAYSAKPLMGDWLETLWMYSVGNAPTPIVTEVPLPATSGMVGSGHYKAAVKSFKDENGGLFVAPWLKKRVLGSSGVLRIPKGYTIGRVGIMGFSAGCGAVSEILANPADRALVDFVYYCDGMHASWDTKLVDMARARQFNERIDGALVQDFVRDADFDNIRAFAAEAAKGKQCMVVSHSQVVPGDAYASTTEAATKLISLVKQDVGDYRPEGSLYPAALFVEEGARESWPVGYNTDEQGTYWTEPYPAWQGCPHKAMFRAPYGVTRAEAIGNFITLGVAVKDQSPEPGCSRAVISSGPAHEFQAEVIQREVVRTVLAERWKTECTKGALEGLSGKVLGLQAAASLVAPRRGPTGTIIKRNPKRLVPIGLSAFGQDDAEACVMEGVFTNLFSLDEIERAKLIAKAKIVGGFALVGLIGKLLWDKYTE